MPRNASQRSLEVQEILTKVPHWLIRFGNLIIFLIIGLAIFLSYLIRYPEVITASAIITSSTPPQKAIARTAGKIDTILVSNGEDIKKGEILAMIQNSANLKDVLLLKERLDSFNLSSDSIEFPLEKIGVLSFGEISSAYSEFERAYNEFKLNINLTPFSNEISANNLSLNELKIQAKSFSSQIELSKQSLELAKKELDRNTKLYNKGIISAQEYESQELQFLEQKRNLKSIENTYLQLKQRINETNKYNEEININAEIENSRTYKNLLLSYNHLRRTISDWEIRYLIKSDISGTVSFMKILNTYQIVEAGELLFTIVPNNHDSYIAKINAPIINSGKIKTGQVVYISLYNFPDEEYGTLEGAIQSISPIPNLDGEYLVTINLKNGLKTSYDIEIPFRFEMTGQARIITEDLRLIERFFYRLRDLFNSKNS